MKQVMSKRTRRVSAVTVAVAGLLLVLTACGGKGNTMDAGGLTQSEAEKMSLEEQYSLLEERFERMQALLTDAQLSVSDGEWTWLDIGRLSDGDLGPDNLDGSTGDNSYYLETARVILPEGAQGDVTDLDPIVAHYNIEGWEQTVSSRDQVSVSHEASAVTDDGWHIQYTVRENGQYSLQVSSNTFWGDRRGLQAAKSDRMVDYGPDASVPGVFATFPKWEDSIVAE